MPSLFSRLQGTGGLWLAVTAAGMLALCFCNMGFFLDDYAHLAAVRGANPIAGPYDVFCFARGDAESTRLLVDNGPYPWFTSPDIKVHFFRFLSSALMVLDHAVFGRWAPGYHLHCALWYAFMAGMVALLFRRSLGGGLAVLALFLFAVDESHAFPVGWWSNRNAVVAGALCLTGVAAHLRWREDGWKPGLPLSLPLFFLGLLAGESGLCALGYVAAYELVGAPGKFAKRAACIAPATLLVFAYLAFYKWAGFGVVGMRVYLDPTSDPVSYLLSAPLRFLILAGNQFMTIPAEIPSLAPVLEWPAALAGLLVLAGVAAGLRLAWPGLTDPERRGLRWMLAGAALSSLPVLAAFTSGRLLLMPSVGGAAALAVIMRHCWRILSAPRPVPAWRIHTARAVLAVLVLAHGVFAALTWPAVALAFGALTRASDAVVAGADMNDPAMAEQSVVYLAAPEPVTGFYTVAMRDWVGLPRPKTWWCLSMAPLDHRITRTGPDRFEMALEGGQMFDSLFEGLIRNPRHHLKPGDTVSNKGFAVTVLEAGETGPTRMEFRFKVPLEDASLRFLAVREGGLSRVTMPPVGETLLLPRDTGLPDWLGR